MQATPTKVSRFHAWRGMGGALAILVVTLATTFYAWPLVRVSFIEQDTERCKDEVRRMIELLRAHSEATRPGRGVYAASPANDPHHSFASNRTHAEAA